MSRIVGIDLGTTNSLVAVWENGESKLIPNAFGEYLTPSVVSMDEEGTIHVGKTAKERLAAYPEMSASLFKRFMGTPKKYKIAGKTYLPEELSAMVLRKLKEDAERYLGETIEEAIISVPAYFNDMARTATKRAGKLAGLKVDRIINEPSAAALACHRMNNEDAVFLVFDFGGGTLDVSLVECFDNIVEIIAVSGDNQLGGQDFDDMIANHFIRTMKLKPDALSLETRTLIRNSAEKCKKALTEDTTATMVVNCDEIKGTLEISRKEIITICAALFERMGKPIRRVLIDSRKSPEKIDKVVLVGGSCHMPVVRQYLEHFLMRKDIEIINPDHMIALGCGVSAGIKGRNGEIKDMLLTDICPFSLGIGIHNEENITKNLMSFIIPRNSPLPVSVEESYYNVWNLQSKVLFEVYQGEAMYAEDNIKLGELEVKIPRRKAGEVECRVRYTYDINGVLEVNVHIPLTGEKKQLVIVNKDLGVSDAEIDEKLKEYEKLKLNPADEEENKYVLAWGERLFMQCGMEYRDEILRRMQYFIHVMKNDPYQITKVRKYLTVFFAFMEKMIGTYVNWDTVDVQNELWYEDEEEQEMDALFKQWNEEDTDK